MPKEVLSKEENENIYTKEEEETKETTFSGLSIANS